MAALASDVIVIQKKLFSIPELMCLRWCRKPLIYDFDDNVTAEHPIKARSPRSAKKAARNRRRFIATCRAADVVVAGNSFLASLARAHNSRVSVVPTPIDTEKYVPCGKEERGEKVVVGWIGTKSNLFYLDQISRALMNVSKVCDIELKVVADRPFYLHGVKVVFKEWREEEEVKDIQSFDIGLMPLTPDQWSLGKCGFKIIQYMSVGIPVIASPIGMNAEIIQDGVTGFLAETDEEWETSVRILVENASRRKTMGLQGRQFVVENFSVPVCVDMLQQVLLSVYRGTQETCSRSLS